MKKRLTVISAYILLAAGVLISGTMVLAAEGSQSLDASSSRGGSPADKYAANFELAKRDANTASAIVAQAQEVLVAIRSGKAPAVTPASSWGPAKYKQISRTFSWGTEVIDGVSLLILYDVHQAIAWSFNRAVLGKDLVYQWRGVGRVDNGIPYGNFRNDWGNNIVFSYDWLDTQKRETVRLNSALNGPIDLVGIPNDANAISKLNLEFFNSFVSLAMTHALLDMKKTPGGLENLINSRFDSGQYRGSKTLNELSAVRDRCEKIVENFSRRDCLEELDLAFSEYGRKLIAGKQLMVHGQARNPNWNAQTQRLEYDSVNIHGELCAPEMVCEGIAPYGRGGSFLACYQLDQPLPNKLSFSMKEQEARGLSQRAGDLRSLEGVGFVIKVTQDASVNDSPQMCREGKNKILIQGRGSLIAKILWNQVASQYAVYEKTASEGQNATGSNRRTFLPAAVPIMGTAGAVKESRPRPVIVIEAK